VELHYLVTGHFNGTPPETSRFLLIQDVLSKLNASHQVIHVHGNNYGSLGIIDGFVVPDCVEVTYLRREGNKFATCGHRFPTSLDQPCRDGVPDFDLGVLGLAPKPEITLVHLSPAE
jgi:hypothetical protein